MNLEQIKALIKELQLSKTGIGWTVSGSDNKKDIETIILNRFHESQEINVNEIMLLQTKIKFYEEMISKSNFAPFLEKTDK